MGKIKWYNCYDDDHDSNVFLGYANHEMIKGKLNIENISSIEELASLADIERLIEENPIPKYKHNKVQLFELTYNIESEFNIKKSLTIHVHFGDNKKSYQVTDEDGRVLKNEDYWLNANSVLIYDYIGYSLLDKQILDFKSVEKKVYFYIKWWLKKALDVQSYFLILGLVIILPHICEMKEFLHKKYIDILHGKYERLGISKYGAWTNRINLQELNRLNIY